MQDVKEMAKAAGRSFPGFTPPGGETQEQVRLVPSIASCDIFTKLLQLRSHSAHNTNSTVLKKCFIYYLATFHTDIHVLKR